MSWLNYQNNPEPQNVPNVAIFETLNLSELISRKILKIGKFCCLVNVKKGEVMK